MKQVVDSNGAPIKGLFKRADKSLVVVNQAEFLKNRTQHEYIQNMQNELDTLKIQMKQILEKLNG